MTDTRVFGAARHYFFAKLRRRGSWCNSSCAEVSESIRAQEGAAKRVRFKLSEETGGGRRDNGGGKGNAAAEPTERERTAAEQTERERTRGTSHHSHHIDASDVISPDGCKGIPPGVRCRKQLGPHIHFTDAPRGQLLLHAAHIIRVDSLAGATPHYLGRLPLKLRRHPFPIGIKRSGRNAPLRGAFPTNRQINGNGAPSRRVGAPANRRDLLCAIPFRPASCAKSGAKLKLQVQIYGDIGSKISTAGEFARKSRSSPHHMYRFTGLGPSATL